MISPSVEQIRERLHKAVEGVIRYRQHLTGCAIDKTDFCSCGLRESMDELHETWHSSFTLLDTLSQSLTEAQGEIERLTASLDLQQRKEQAENRWLELRQRAEQAESALAAMREERDVLRPPAENYNRTLARAEKAEALVAHLTEERDRATTNYPELPTLMNEGRWQEATMLLIWKVDSLYKQQDALTEEREGLRAKFDALAQWSRDEIAALTAAHERVKTLLTDVASSGFEDIDPRIDYVDVQIDRELWTELRSALTSPEGPPQDTAAIGRQLPAGLWVSIQGVVMQTLGPVVISEEDWHRIAAKIPFRGVGETPEPSRGRASHAPDCPCPQCALAREAEVARKLKDHTPERSG